MTPQEIMQEIQFLNKYARFDYAKGQRERWGQTVGRTVEYLKKVAGEALSPEVESEIFTAIFNREISPSMRLMATAGRGADRNQIGIYNCSFLPLQSPDDLYDLTILLGHGVGVGFSVEKSYVDKWLPIQYHGTSASYLQIQDSIESWADSFWEQVRAAQEGMSLFFDYSLLRPAGEPLMTRGGTSSGPEPLRAAHEKIRLLLAQRQGEYLTSVDLLDIACHIASAIVSGGVRRSAMIAIFDQDDQLMVNAKSGEWYLTELQRQYANVSMIIENRMTLEEWQNWAKVMDENKSGEPGIWSRYAIYRHLPERRDYHPGMGANPCGEVILRPYEFCNLSQIIARQDDTEENLLRKIRLATIVGTIQSAMVDFHVRNGDFKKNSEKERLLGVSLSGIMDCPLLSEGDPKILKKLRAEVILQNKIWAAALGIAPSVSSTCIKPDGNTSVLYDTSPGVHGRFAPFYIRRMRVQARTPIANFALASGIPAEPAFGESWENYNTLVLSFPVKSPAGAVLQRQRGAIAQLDNWLRFKKNYTEMNPSVTINYSPEELMDIAGWLFKHQDHAVGLSFIPTDNSSYQQMPYEEITENQYEEMCAAFNVDMEKFWEFEDSKRDTTETIATLACTAGACLV